MHRNGGLQNNIECPSSNPFSFVVGNVSPTRSTIECNVCRFRFVCVVLYHTRIIYIHSTYVGMSRVCIHLGVHDHIVAKGTCCESLDMAY